MSALLQLLALLFAADVDALGSRDFRTRHEAHLRLERVGMLAIPALKEGLRSGNVERYWRCERLLSHAGWNYEWAVGLTTRYVMMRDWKAAGLHGWPGENVKLDPDLKRIADDDRFCLALLDCAAFTWQVPFGFEYRNIPREQRYWLLWDMCCKNHCYRLPISIPQVMEKP